MSIHVITFIIPCFNESETLHELYGRLSVLAKELDSYEFEFLFVNDGSLDATENILNHLSENDSRVKVLHFATNRGHQLALSAGMDFANGDVLVTIDADLQDPPELLHDMLLKIEEGYDVVHAQRRHRSGETWFKLFTAKAFYLFMRMFSTYALIENCGDFRAFTRPVLEVARRFRERHKFLRGSFVLFGFRQKIIQYDRYPRYAGSTKYSPIKMMKFATDAIIGFSTVPIKVVMLISLVLLATSGAYLVRALIYHFYFHITVRGWTSLIVFITFFASLQLFCLAIIGAYISRIFEQGQNRPLYWLSDVRNINLEQAATDSPDIAEIIISRNIFSSTRKNSQGPIKPI